MKTMKLWERHEVNRSYPSVAGGLTECVAIPGGGAAVEVTHALRVAGVVVLTCRETNLGEGETCCLTPEQAESIAASLRYHATEARKIRGY